MPSTRILLTSIIGIIVLTFGLVYWFISDLEATLKEEETSSQSTANESNNESNEEIDPARYIDKEEDSDDSLPSEKQFRDRLHGMTHQKVFADEKWTLLELTDQRVDEMLEDLSKAKNENQYDHYEFYHDTLTQWKRGNFDNAVEVHNRLWEMKGGTIGRAQRLLTTEEERAFVEKHYD
ncbi:DUF6241 domain-containing protein [Alkalihalobacillus sp. R86527]|uniref:DUF6241 domain-containing protein n=1 Tax=Alkalihalobacillus sp. R86527 TaxID=3093863 RepID=UPI00366F4383